MVLLHVKRQDESLFFYSTTTDQKVEKVLEDVVHIQNDRMRMLSLLKGIKKYQEESLERNGNCKENEQLKKITSEIEVFTSQKMIEAATSLTPSVTTEMLINIKDSLDIIFPAELQPDFLSLWNEAQPKALDSRDQALWFSAKEMKAGRPLSEYTGRNEKSKVVVKLHARNQGPPSRESALTEEDRAHLMLQAFRRQQELERSRTVQED